MGFLSFLWVSLVSTVSSSTLFFTRALVPEGQAAEALGTLKRSGAFSDIGEHWARKAAPSPFFRAPKNW
jgi:hypothetical protein